MYTINTTTLKSISLGNWRDSGILKQFFKGGKEASLDRETLSNIHSVLPLPSTIDADSPLIDVTTQAGMA